jgi:hypothetical protein
MRQLNPHWNQRRVAMPRNYLWKFLHNCVPVIEYYRNRVCLNRGGEAPESFMVKRFNMKMGSLFILYARGARHHIRFP